MFYTCNYNIRVTHRNSQYIFLHESDSLEGSSADCSLFILSLHALALHLVVKILLQIFLYEDLSTLALHTLSVVFPSRMPAGPHFVTQPILLRNILIFDINHQQNTRRSDQIETIKTIMQTTRLVSYGRFYQWLSCHFLKKYSIKCEKIDCELFYSELNVTTSILYLLI